MIFALWTRIVQLQAYTLALDLQILRHFRKLHVLILELCPTQICLLQIHSVIKSRVGKIPAPGGSRNAFLTPWPQS